MSHDDRPICFSISGSTRHDFVDVPDAVTLSKMSEEISAVASTSPNCEEFMAKFSKDHGARRAVTAMKIRWSMEGRDKSVWPKETKVTEENVRALLRAMDRARDVVDVELK